MGEDTMDNVTRNFLKREKYQRLNTLAPGQGHCAALQDLEKGRESALADNDFETFILFGAKIKAIRIDLTYELDLIEGYKLEDR